MKYLYAKGLKGGLGNQLFMIFNTIARSLANDGDYYFFQHLAYKHNINKVPNNLVFKNIAIKIIDKVGNNKKLNKLIENKDYEIVKIKGYMQTSLDYDRFDRIVDLIGFRDYQINIKNKYNSLFNPKFKYISMHFRYGDYDCHSNLTKEKPHQILFLNYYINCINNILKNEDKNKLKFLIFFEYNDQRIFDMIDKLKNMFDINYEIIDIEIMPDESLTIQSLCNYNIIANSTFSLWSALLNNNIDRKVFCPNKGKNIHRNIYNHYKFNKISID